MIWDWGERSVCVVAAFCFFFFVFVFCGWGLHVSSLIEELCVRVVCEHACGGKRGGGMLPPARGKLSVSFIQELATIVSGVEFAAGVNEQLCAKKSAVGVQVFTMLEQLLNPRIIQVWSAWGIWGLSFMENLHEGKLINTWVFWWVHLQKRCARKAEICSWFSKWHALDIFFRVCLRKQLVLHVDGICLCLCSIYELELFLSHVTNHTSLCNDHGSPGWSGSVYSWSLSKQHLSDFTFW